MSRVIVQDIIQNFEIGKFIHFFREKNRSFSPKQASLQEFNDNNFSNIHKLGSMAFKDGNLIICSAEVKKELSERSGKKAQYELGKKILKTLQTDAGIFIFYNQKGNFRFSLIYTNYLGRRRDWSTFRRFTYFVSKDLTNKTFSHRIGDGDFSSLEKVKEAFSVEKVTKEFYKELAYWYFWACKVSQPPEDASRQENGNEMFIIRLITRIVFIWFMRQKDSLIPDILFKRNKLEEILKDFSPASSTYYKAILQNLFFATLSTKTNKRKFRSEFRAKKGWNKDFGNRYVYRYYELFKKPEMIETYFEKIPFLNGGLFECLDNKDNNNYIDGFTERKKYQPIMPNYLFFGSERRVNLNLDFGTKNKIYKVRGLLNLLSSYNFTIDENTPDDQDVALDPELLGRVFENLLASFNPETSTTARKATGSYYTPRVIVDYMVTESLKAYFKTHHDEFKNIDEKLEKLFFNVDNVNPFSIEETEKLVRLIENIRIVDPAVGSGAFPMGVLNKMVFILNKIDPGNELWKQAQINAVDKIPDPSARKIAKEKINEYFENKNADYGRKLYLIQKCIYGVDIQQIAVEIARLRFFISLMVEEQIEDKQENKGIEPLPNLDFKLMRGNSLIEYGSPSLIIKGEDEEKNKLIDYLINQKEKYFFTFDHKEKQELFKNINNLIILLKNYDKQKKLEKENAVLDGYKRQTKLFGPLLDENLSFDDNRPEVMRQIKKVEKIENQLINPGRDHFEWHLYFSEVFEKRGFDIVIANPPYVRADKPEIKDQREIIMKSRTYQTLYEKWDLYVAFIEKGYQLLKQNGILEFIIPDAYMSSKYAIKSHNYFLQNAIISRINFLNEIRVFEAAVKNIIIEYQKGVDPNNMPLKIKHLQTFEKFVLLPSRSQKEIGEFVFKVANENKKIGDLNNTINWGDICYVSVGLVLQSGEKLYKGEFIKKDLISDQKDKIHNKPYIEAKWIKKYFIENIKYLEWNTSRVPKKIRRTTFSELYEPKKIMMGGMTGAIFDSCGLLCNHSIIVSVLWKDLSSIENRSIANSIKKNFKLKGNISEFRKRIQNNSKNFHSKYLLAILNSKLAKYYLNQVRRSQIGFYPDDLKKLPIKIISIDNQKPFIETVDKIMAITKSSDYLENPTKQIQVKEYEKQIDQLVYKLYGLTQEEIKIVEHGS